MGKFKSNSSPLDKFGSIYYLFYPIRLMLSSPIIRDNVHSHLCRAKRPMAVSFLPPPPHPPSSIRPLQSGKVLQHIEGPVFKVDLESIALALCEYVTGAGFPSRPSELFFNKGRVNNRNIKNENDMESVLKGKQFLNIPSTR